MKPSTPSSPSRVANEAFAQDVREGLTADPKFLQSKYFYDRRGDELFQRIMAMPEYYLTRCEQEIFERQHHELLQAIPHRPFDLVELGAGDGSKTKVLLRHFLEEGVSFRYRPVDISGNVLDALQQDLQQSLPELDVHPLRGDYMKMLEKIHIEDEVPKVLLFLGSNIGNFERPAALAFLRRLAALMEPDDFLLLGIDLKKEPALIKAAYDDKAGLTAAFNTNILQRINRELGGHFDLDTFLHWEAYDPSSGAARSYLVSRQAQVVAIDQLDLRVAFDAWEPIRVELSQKYSLREVEALAAGAGMEVERHFLDSRHYFVDTLWRKP